MTRAKMQGLRYHALTLGLRISKVKNHDKFYLYRVDGKEITDAPNLMTLAELEAVLAKLKMKATD